MKTKRYFHTVGMVLALLLATSLADAASSETEAALAKVRAMGKALNREVLKKTRAIYVPLLQKAAKADVTVSKDIAYGSDQKQKLDIYAPSASGKDRSVVVFIHGGGMRGGDKGDLIYGNVTTFFARHGVIGVNANYRLVPKIKWPEGGKDMASIVVWLKKNIAQYGGSPDRIFLMGHSGGGAHVADYINHADIQPGGKPGIAGAILVSGGFAASKSGPRVKVMEAYYGTDPTQWDARSPLGMAKAYSGVKVPTFVIVAELDINPIERASVDMYALLCKRDGCPRYKQVQGHNHTSVVMHLNTDDNSLGPDLLDFVNRTVRQMAAK